MNLFQPIKQWASFGGSEPAEAPVNPFIKAKVPFEKKYPKVSNPITYNDAQRADIMPRLGFATVGRNEVDLALSRTPADTDYTSVANYVKAAISHFRAEHPDDSDAAAARKLLEGSSSLAAIDGKHEAARLAAELADREHEAFDQSYREFRLVPAKHEQLASKIASLDAESNRLKATDFDAKIRQLLTFEYNPKPGVVIHESIPSLLMQRDTLALRLEVISELIDQCRTALDELVSSNK